MLIELPQENKTYETVWDKPIPILKVDAVTYRVYMLDEIGHPQDYGEVLELLNDLDDSCTVKFFLNTPGGVLDTTSMLMDAIVKCKAHIIGSLSGTVASAGTMLALVMDRLEIAPFTSFMIHAYSGSSGGKANEIKAQQAHAEKEIKKLFQEVYKGFLTDKEVKKILKGTDMWMNKEEVEQRLERRGNVKDTAK